MAIPEFIRGTPQLLQTNASGDPTYTEILIASLNKQTTAFLSFYSLKVHEKGEIKHKEMSFLFYSHDFTLTQP